MIRAIIILLTLTGCGARSNIWDTSPMSAPTPSPIGQMMNADARGERYCVRNDVVIKGKCR